ncbi:hypothetical protein SAMN04488518_109245 [Pseudovibrio ascidiaceicola]|uniref:Uncharacterized protein n=1 Tax=Pseudovibrio ascidiaceicola TaxID=285279 RepID=A0A1I4CMQ0_9HYPH|nr:hypothetical protein SAMN04488518_109245 [Pseudovibrio ascidiaceicola]
MASFGQLPHVRNVLKGPTTVIRAFLTKVEKGTSGGFYINSYERPR